MQQHGGNLFMLHTCSMTQGVGSEFFKNILSENNFVAIGYHENTTCAYCNLKVCVKTFKQEQKVHHFLSNL